MNFPTTIMGFIHWLIPVAIVCVIFAVIYYALDRYFFPKMPEPVRFFGNIILGLLFLVAFASVAFGIAL